MMQQRSTYSRRRNQHGVTLVEVLIAVFVSAIGVLGAAGMQLNALKYTDSSRMTSQASFIVYDIIDRMRANATDGALDNYTLTDIASAPASPTTVGDQDLKDFADNVKTSLTDGDGSITVSGSKVTVQVGWSEGRAGGIATGTTTQKGSFSVTTEVKPKVIVGGGS